LISAAGQVKTRGMDQGAKAGFGEDFAAALDWWREAGVDADFADAPTSWLKAEEAAQQRPRAGGDPRQTHESAPTDRGPRLRAGAEPAPVPPLPAIDRSAWPQDLAAFSAWWLSDPALDDGRISGRVPPRGNAGAAFMIIVPEPEREDADTLLSGPQGKLLDAMLAAMQIAPDQTYVASALPRHTPMPDWDSLAAKGIGAVLGHHIKLVGPQRLIVLGAHILPLLGNDPAHNPAVSRTFNQEGQSIPLLAGKNLSALLERPRWKAGFWQGWLDWTGGSTGQG
jgi:DNA polymerase